MKWFPLVVLAMFFCLTGFSPVDVSDDQDSDFSSMMSQSPDETMVVAAKDCPKRCKKAGICSPNCSQCVDQCKASVQQCKAACKNKKCRNQCNKKREKCKDSCQGMQFNDPVVQRFKQQQAAQTTPPPPPPPPPAPAAVVDCPKRCMKDGTCSVPCMNCVNNCKSQTINCKAACSNKKCRGKCNKKREKCKKSCQKMK